MLSIPKGMAENEAFTRKINNAKDYAKMYLMVKKRQRGCDGMGDFHALKEEFYDAARQVLAYCTDPVPLNDEALDLLALELEAMEHEQKRR